MYKLSNQQEDIEALQKKVNEANINFGISFNRTGKSIIDDGLNVLKVFDAESLKGFSALGMRIKKTA